MSRRRKEIDLLIDLTAAVVKNDPVVRGMLATQRNGHPGSRPPLHHDDEGNGPPSYPDPTGEWAITPDNAASMLRRYHRREKVAIRALEDMDAIARMALPTEVDRSQVADPDEWCKNCIRYGHCAPRNSRTDHYCRWCITIHTAWHFYPPQGVVDLHHNGQHSKIVSALQAHKRARK